MSGLAITKPWTVLTADAIGSVPAQLGVFEIADADEAIRKIGYAGGAEMFGLRSALDRELEELLSEGVDAGSVRFRFELTHGYLTRWEELLMVHQAQHGRLPAGNADYAHRIGRLTLT
jgi:hypothetical protein